MGRPATLSRCPHVRDGRKVLEEQFLGPCGKDLFREVFEKVPDEFRIEQGTCTLQAVPYSLSPVGKECPDDPCIEDPVPDGEERFTGDDVEDRRVDLRRRGEGLGGEIEDPACGTVRTIFLSNVEYSFIKYFSSPPELFLKLIYQRTPNLHQ